MKREDFKIERIPEGYRAYDVDLTPSGRPVLGIAHPHDQSAPAFIITGAAQTITIPGELLWRYRDLMLKPRVRAAGENLVLAQRMRARHDAEQTAWIWTGDGQFVSSFAGGDDCEELLGDADHLLLYYGDEAGGAMCVYSTDGIRMWSQAEEFPEARIFVWFHAAAWAAPDEAAIWADVQRGGRELSCAYIRLNVRERCQQVFSPPLGWSLPRAVTVAADRVLVHGASTHDRDLPKLPDASEQIQRVERHDIVSWKPGTMEWQIVEQVDRPLRGLPGGRFIAVQPDGYTILSFD